MPTPRELARMLEQAPGVLGRGLAPGQKCRLHVFDVASRSDAVVAEFDDTLFEAPNRGDWQVPLGRRMRALKIWSVVNGAGLEGLRESIRSHVAMADSLADRIAREQGFALATPPSLALVCLYLVDRDGLPDDVATKAAIEAVNVEGRSFLTHTSVNGHFAIRVAIGTPTAQPDHIDTLWDSLRNAARQSGA